MRRLRWLTVLPAMCFLLSSCGSSSKTTTSTPATSGTTSASASSAKVGGKLVIDNVSGSTWTCQFNPFNSALLGPGITFALMYEPLEFVNILQSNNAPKPMLATSSKWSNGFKTLTFTIRDGVKWTDGQPFSARDVTYTFNAM